VDKRRYVCMRHQLEGYSVLLSTCISSGIPCRKINLIIINRAYAPFLTFQFETQNQSTHTDEFSASASIITYHSMRKRGKGNK
jgi:hypothetical protein